VTTLQALRIRGRDGRPGQQIRIAPMRGQKALDFRLQIRIPLAGFREKRVARFRRAFHDSLKKVANLSKALRCHVLPIPNSGIFAGNSSP
jgi:hypothetical protein